MLVRLTLATLASAALLSGTALARPAPPPAPDQAPGPMCRRAPPLASLPPEPPIRKPQQPRWKSRGGEDIVTTGARTPSPVTTPALTETAPPPPPPAPPPPPPPAVSTRTADSSAPTGHSAFVPRRPGQPQPQAGLLTAGDHDDLLNPELYAAYVDRFLSTETLDGVPRVDTGSVLTVAVRDAAGRPVPFADVTLTCADGNRLTLATVADGKAVFFPGLDHLGGRVTMTAGARGAAASAPRAIQLAGQPGAQLQSVTLAGDPARPVRKFDLALMIDTTGSMTDELDYLQAELRSILAALKQDHPDLDMRVALVAYRDIGDDYITRTYDFTSDLAAMQADLAAQRADGGGDYPEAVERAIARVDALHWRPDAVKSLLFVADAPPHADDVAATWAATEVARARRIQIVPVAASGVAAGAEYLMRAMAAVTQSRYIFLTDDSGIGNPHAPPAVDCYLVTRLDHLVRRVLDGQISGRRIEPKPGEVIRTVGAYDDGRCIRPPDADADQGG